MKHNVINVICCPSKLAPCKLLHPQNVCGGFAEMIWTSPWSLTFCCFSVIWARIRYLCETVTYGQSLLIGSSTTKAHVFHGILDLTLNYVELLNKPWVPWRNHVKPPSTPDLHKAIPQTMNRMARINLHRALKKPKRQTTGLAKCGSRFTHVDAYDVVANWTQDIDNV